MAWCESSSTCYTPPPRRRKGRGNYPTGRVVCAPQINIGGPWWGAEKCRRPGPIPPEPIPPTAPVPIGIIVQVRTPPTEIITTTGSYAPVARLVIPPTGTRLVPEGTTVTTEDIFEDPLRPGVFVGSPLTSISGTSTVILPPGVPSDVIIFNGAGRAVVTNEVGVAAILPPEEFELFIAIPFPEDLRGGLELAVADFHTPSIPVVFNGSVTGSFAVGLEGPVGFGRRVLGAATTFPRGNEVRSVNIYKGPVGPPEIDRRAHLVIRAVIRIEIRPWRVRFMYNWTQTRRA